MVDFLLSYVFATLAFRKFFYRIFLLGNAKTLEFVFKCSVVINR